MKPFTELYADQEGIYEVGTERLVADCSYSANTNEETAAVAAEIAHRVQMHAGLIDVLHHALDCIAHGTDPIDVMPRIRLYLAKAEGK